MARRFASEGALVVVNDVNSSAAKATVIELDPREARPLLQAVMFRLLRALQASWGAPSKEIGRIDVLINNAGYTHTNQSLLTVSGEDFDRVFSVNVKAIYHSPVPLFHRCARQRAVRSSISGQLARYDRARALAGIAERRVPLSRSAKSWRSSSRPTKFA